MKRILSMVLAATLFVAVFATSMVARATDPTVLLEKSVAADGKGLTILVSYFEDTAEIEVSLKGDMPEYAVNPVAVASLTVSADIKDSQGNLIWSYGPLANGTFGADVWYTSPRIDMSNYHDEELAVSLSVTADSYQPDFPRYRFAWENKAQFTVPHEPPFFPANYAYIFGYEPEFIPKEDGSYQLVLKMGMDDAVTIEQVCAMVMRLVDQQYGTQGVEYPLTENIAQYAGQWFARGLAYASHKGAFDGIESVQIGKATRGDVARIVALGLDLTRTRETPFTDIAGNFNEEFIKQMYAYKFMSGTAYDTFSPEKDMTRAEFCAMFNRVTGKDHLGLLARDGNGNTFMVTHETYFFTDMDNVNHWGYEICLKATSNYDDDGYIDVSARLDNIRNVLDKFPGQVEY